MGVDGRPAAKRYEIVAAWRPTQSSSRSSWPTTTRSCAPGCGWCSSARAASRSSSEAGDAESALRTCSGTSPTVLVLDLNMPGELELARRDPARAGGLARHARRGPDDAGGPGVRPPGAARRGARLRAQGGRRRGARRGGAAAAEGGTYLNPRLGAALAAAPPEPSGPPDDLTEREVEVLRLIALGHTNAEIAKQLYLSVRTVESHRAHIQQKLGRSTRAELVRYALDHGFVKAQ